MFLYVYSEMQLMAQQFAMPTPDIQKEQDTSVQEQANAMQKLWTKVNFWRFKWDTTRQVNPILSCAYELVTVTYQDQAMNLL